MPIDEELRQWASSGLGGDTALIDPELKDWAEGGLGRGAAWEMVSPQSGINPKTFGMLQPPLYDALPDEAKWGEPRDPKELTPQEHEQVLSTVDTFAKRGWLETTAGNTTPGLVARGIARALYGNDYREPPSEDFGPVGNAASSVASFAGDPVAWGTFGVGSAAAKGAAQTFGKAAAGRLLTEKVLPIAVEKGISAGTALATLTAIHDPLQQYVATGDADYLQTARKTLDSALIGGMTGPAGAMGKLALPAEYAVFATVPAVLEGRTPNRKDALDAGLTLFGFKIAQFIPEAISAKLSEIRDARIEKNQGAVPSKAEYEDVGLGELNRSERLAVSNALDNQRSESGGNDATPGELIEHANNRLLELDNKANGVKGHTVEFEGQKITTPDEPAQFLSYQEKAERKFLQKNKDNPGALARAYRKAPPLGPGEAEIPPTPIGEKPPMEVVQGRRVEPESTISATSDQNQPLSPQAGQVPRETGQSSEAVRADELPSASPGNDAGTAAQSEISGQELPSELASASAKNPADPPHMGATAIPRNMPVRLDRPPGVVATTSAPEVIKALTDAATAVGMTVPVKTGRLQSSKHAGEFYPQAEAIRTAQANDIPTATHEVGHAIEKSLGKRGLQGLPGGVHGELVSLGQIIYAKEPHNGWASEGMAETVRLYVTDRAKLKSLAPKAEAWFENDVLGKNPKLKEAMSAAVDQAKVWAEQGSYNRAKESMVDVGSPTEAIAEAAKGAKKFASAQEWIDSNEPFRVFAAAAEKRLGHEIPIEENPAELSGYYTKGLADRRVGHMVNRGMVDVAGNVVGGPLRDVASIVKKSGKSADDFALYLWAKRTIAETYGRKGKMRATGLDPKDAEQIVKELETPEMQLAASKYYDWNEGILNYAAQASPSLASAVEAIRADSPGYYAPLARVFQDFERQYVSGGAGGNVEGATITGRFKGSGRQVKNILTQTIKNAQSIVEAAHSRAVMDAMIDLSKVEGMGHLTQKVKRKMEPVASRSVSDLVVGIAKATGLNSREIKEFIDTNGGDISALVSIFAPEKKAPGGEYILPYYDKVAGKLDFYEIAPPMYEAATGADPYMLPPAVKMILSPIRALGTAARAGYTTLRPVFSLARNPARDFPDFMVQSRAEGSSGRLFAHYLRSLGEMIARPVAGQSKTFDLYERLGIGASHMIGGDISKSRQAARKMFQGKMVTVADPRNWVSAFADAINWPEALPRSAELRAVLRDAGVNPDTQLAPGGSHLSLPEAMRARKAAAQVTTDFERGGRFAKAVNPYIPFFNATIQGTRTSIEALRRNPQRYMVRAVAGITVPTLIGWWYNKDKEWYKELDDRERFGYAHIDVGDNVIRIPRGHGELNSIFGALPEALLNSWYYSDPAQATAWAKQTLGALLPDPTNVPLVKEGVQQLANKDYFFDRPIVPEGLDRRPVAEQYNEYTTRVSKFVGKMLNASPERIDHALRTIFGPNSTDAASLLGSGDAVPGKEKEASDLPLVGWAFMRGGELGPRPRSVQEVYDLSAEFQRRGASQETPETYPQKNKRLMLDDATRAISRLSWIRSHTAKVDDRQKITIEMLDIAKQAIAASKAEFANPEMFQGRANVLDYQQKQLKKKFTDAQ